MASSNPNVVYLIADAMRPDYLGCYGNENVLTSEIDALADQGTLFENVISSAPWTAPSIATHASGMQPHTLELYTADDLVEDDIPTIFERFNAAGYTTAAFSDSERLKNQWATAADQRGMSLNLIQNLEFISDHSKEPFFLWNHYRGTHLPYVLKYSPESYYRRQKEFLDRLRGGAVEEMKYRYARSIEQFSEWYVGAIIDRLKKEGIFENTIILITSDHGEHWGKRLSDQSNLDLFDLHGPLLYNEVLKVPLIIANADIAGGQRIGELVRSIDILPTLIDYLNSPSIDGSRSLDGQSLSPCIMGREQKFPERAISSTSAVAEPDREGAEVMSKASIIRGDWKLIWTPGENRIELYDLSSDFNESNNLVDEYPDKTEALVDELRSELPREGYSTDEQQEILNQLEDLGYR